MAMIITTIIVLLVTADAENFNPHFWKQELRNKCFLKDVLAVVRHTPNQLAVHRSTNTLYFSSDTSNGEYVPVILNIDTKTLKLIKGVKDAYAITCNNLDNEVYFGGSSGIHRYRPIDKTLTSLAITNLDVWWLYFKKDLYFVQFPNLHVYVYKDRTIKVVRQLKNTGVQQFVFDREGHIFFVNSSGLFGVKKFTHQHILLRSRPVFTGMATDNAGEVYVSTDSAIYMVNKTEQKVKRVVRISGVMAMTFDKDNHLIYSDALELARLVPVESGVYNSSQDSRTYFCN